MASPEYAVMTIPASAERCSTQSMWHAESAQQFLGIVPGAIPAEQRIGRPGDAHALPFPE
jgi:hypothetical protein